MKEWCWAEVPNPQPLDYQLDMHPTEPQLSDTDEIKSIVMQRHSRWSGNLLSAKRDHSLEAEDLNGQISQWFIGKIQIYWIYKYEQRFKMSRISAPLNQKSFSFIQMFVSFEWHTTCHNIASVITDNTYKYFLFLWKKWTVGFRNAFNKHVSRNIKTLLWANAFTWIQSSQKISCAIQLLEK